MIASTNLDAREMEAIAARHPHLLQSSAAKRRSTALITAGVVLYMIFSWWFFSIGHVLANANWGLPAPISQTGYLTKCGPRSPSHPMER